MTNSWQDIQQLVVSFRNERNWRDYHSPKNMIISLFVEAGELAEHFQYWSEEELPSKLTSLHEEIADELCDVLFWVVLIAHDFSIDLGKAFQHKMVKNAKGNSTKGYQKIELEVKNAPTTFLEMIDIIDEFRRLTGWSANQNPRDVLLKLMEEIGELAWHLQWKKQDEIHQHIVENSIAISEELIDVLICTLMLFHYLDYEIDVEFVRKMKKNKEKYPINKYGLKLSKMYARK